MQHSDQLYGYSTILLAAAPVATQLAIAHIRWVLFFPVYAIPALALMTTVGNLSKCGPVQTFRKMAPISAGIGWALTWHCAEKLYYESLRAAQLLMYILFSIRPTLNWALSCNHAYNSEYCHDFFDSNTSVTEKTHHYPDNFWPAQEFNRYVIRDNQIITKMPATWEPNMWYLGPSDENFQFTIPSLHLLSAHFLTWSVIYLIITKFYDRLGDILLRVFVLLPFILYITVVIALTVFGFHFTSQDMQVELDDKKINEDPYDFWADLRGGFRTSILIVDYSTAFTGIVLFASSRLRSGVAGLNALFLVPVMMLVPCLLTILRTGCEGHISDLQPDYKIYASTDETISFDVLPVCFAVSPLGPVWSALFFVAHYLYSSIGPMIVYTAFIYQSFIDDFPIVQNTPQNFIRVLCLAFTLPSVFLYMPLGTKIAAFFRYTSQSAFVQLFTFIVVFFVYGWKRIDQDVLMTSSAITTPSLSEILKRPTNPWFTILTFTVVPMLLCAKFVAVFDFLANGTDVTTHIAAGTQFLPFPKLFAQIFGYLIMFAPLIIVIVGAIAMIYQLVFCHKLPWTDLWKPTAEWMSHAVANTPKPKRFSLTYLIVGRFFRNSGFRSVLFALFCFETFIGMLLVVLFFLNSTSLVGWGTSRTANDYRSVMLLVFVVSHIFVLFRMRKNQMQPVAGTRLDMYIALATIQTAMLNAYMWMFAADHKWGLDLPPIFIIFGNTVIRGSCILLAIAANAHAEEHHRPSNTREASEIDENDLTSGTMDPDDDSPVIFELANV